MKQTMMPDLAIQDLCRSLALQLHAGVAPADGLFLLGEEWSGAEKERILAMGRSMDAGKRLHEAMEESGAFPQYAVGLLAVGERAGRTEEALNALADFYQRRSALRRQLRTGIAYPALLAAMMLAVIAVLLVRVLPVFDDVYTSLGTGLTGLAGGLLRVGGILGKALPVILIVLALAAAFSLLLFLCKPLRETLSRCVRARFGDRGVLRKYNNAHFAQALAMALRSGLAPEEGIVLGAELLKDSPAEARAAQCLGALHNGVSLHEALAQAQLLQPKHSRLLALGQRSGNADLVMENLAAELSDEAEHTLERIVSCAEPAMVLIASALVGVILLAVMLPLLDILSVIG